MVIASAVLAPEPLETVRLLGQDIARADLASIVDHLVGLADGDRCSYVVTTNVDHIVELARNERFRRAYAGAAVRLADGAPVVAVGRLTGRNLPGRVTGADLMPVMCQEAAMLGLRVAIVGGSERVNQLAVERLEQMYPGIDVSGWSPYGFEEDELASLEIVRRLEELKPKIVFVCFGAPRSEIWVAEHAHLLPPCVAICAGAAVDFIAGELPRAPVWVQSVGMEWLFRLVQEPNRLWRRYLVRDLAFLPIAGRDVVGRLREQRVSRREVRRGGRNRASFDAANVAHPSFGRNGTSRLGHRVHPPRVVVPTVRATKNVSEGAHHGRRADA
jgi:N-acetylglucosaminyldiphosphoundecaprenol N-acetyl-beta-D-mannosaminyltransferase